MNEIIEYLPFVDALCVAFTCLYFHHCVFEYHKFARRYPCVEKLVHGCVFSECTDAACALMFRSVFHKFLSSTGYARRKELLTMCARRDRGETLGVLIDLGYPFRRMNDWLLRRSAGNGCLRCLRTLLAKGADVHAQYDYALRFAAGNGHVEVVRFLLDANAYESASHFAALKLAARGGRAAVVELLLPFMKGTDSEPLMELCCSLPVDKCWKSNIVVFRRTTGGCPALSRWTTHLVLEQREDVLFATLGAVGWKRAFPGIHPNELTACIKHDKAELFAELLRRVSYSRAFVARAICYARLADDRGGYADALRQYYVSKYTDGDLVRRLTKLQQSYIPKFLRDTHFSDWL